MFIGTHNAFHPTNKFTAEWSREEINFIDDNVGLRKGNLKLTYISNQLTLISFLTQHLVTHTTVRKVYPTLRLWDITEFVQLARTSRNDWWKGALVKGWQRCRSWCSQKHQVIYWQMHRYYLNNTFFIIKLNTPSLNQKSLINNNIVNKRKCIDWFNYKIVIGS